VRALRSLGAAVAVVAIVTVIVRSGIFADLSIAGLRGRIESYGALAPLAFMGLIFAGAFVPSPLLLLTAVGGAIFGAVAAFTYVWVAGVVATAIPFALMRQAVGGWVDRLPAARFRGLRAIDRRLNERGFATVLALRVVLCMAPPLSWGLGATSVRWRDYVGGTALGIVPAIALVAHLGEAITRAGSWTALLTPGVVVPALLAVAGIVAGTLVARRMFAL
jgi:uncharacterized membrane protein YdjX (TVP38/TMEM64 family)